MVKTECSEWTSQDTQVKPVNTRWSTENVVEVEEKHCVQRKCHNITIVKINEHIIYVKKVKKLKYNEINSTKLKNR